MRYTLLFALLGVAASVRAQDPVVQSVLDAVRIDSMLLYVNELSGEVPVDVGNGLEYIVSRHSYNAGNAVAQSYLEQKLEQFGYVPQVQTFNSTGRNVMAVKTGLTYPDEIVILCAHYDAMPAGILAAPAADDDGSGTAAVLEAARILRDVPFAYTIVFALWDEEEQNKVGSTFYAGSMAANDALIRGVINMDAIAYDGNGDRKARIHTRPIANSFELSDSVFSVRAQYDIDLDLLLTNPGATYSDHASFWNNGYGAILVIEEFGADGNPYYHTPDDRVQYFDVPYYEKLAKLSIATLATIAEPIGAGQGLGGTAPSMPPAIYAYPNPAEGQVTAWLEVPAAERYQVVLLDALGREVHRMHEGGLGPGKHHFIVPMDHLQAGSYALVALPENGMPLSLQLVRTP
jgi:hypothetical protein